jgi:DNA-binding NarL/FixJ family response regulator
VSAAPKTPVTPPTWHPSIPSPDVCHERARMLTARQRQVLGLLACGWQPKEIARQLGLACTSVNHCLEQSYRKLGVGNSNQALAVVCRAEAPAPVELVEAEVVGPVEWRPRSVFEMSAAELARAS